ncbi:unnamed protein product [Effrenium voratum]|nr:unnamed protein product [Effrenium voratum]
MLLFAVMLVAAAAVPTFHIDLEVPPQRRWAKVTDHYREEMHSMLSKYREIMQTKYSAQELAQWVSLIKANKADHEQEYHEELQGDHRLAAAVQRALRNLDYKFAFRTPDGVEHDWPDVTFNAVFWRKGRQLIVATSFVLYNGIHTGMRFGGWTFEQNTRHTNDKTLNLEAMNQGGHLFGWAVRSHMENIPSFAEAVQAISKTNFAAPQYFIMAGAGPFEGAVITQDRGISHLPDTPATQFLSNETGTWHLLQTNDDSNKLPADIRRPLTQFDLSKHKQEEVSPDFVWRYLEHMPLHSSVTVFSVLAVPQTGYWFTATRSEPAPKVKPALASGRVGHTKWARRALLTAE